MKKNLKKLSSWLMIIALLIAAIPLSAAAADVDLSVFSAVAAPEIQSVNYNENLSIEVATSVSATRVKITYPTGEIYNLADIGSGFSGYRDEGSRRIWTIGKRNQIIGKRTYYVYAGYSGGYGNSYVQVGESDVRYITCEFCNAAYIEGTDHLCEEGKRPVIELNKTQFSLTEGKTSSILAEITPASSARIIWNSSNDGVATVSNGIVTAVFTGKAVITASLEIMPQIKAQCEVTVVSAGEPNEPPFPFWKDYLQYPTSGTKVYYMGKIYQNKWWANAGDAPGSADVWELVGDAEWTVPEDPKNYQKDDGGTSEEDINKILTEEEINTLWGGIKEEYSVEAALGRLEELIPESYYNELFPYRFGSEQWKASSAAKAHYPGGVGDLPDYYAYNNLKQALSELANTIIKVEWYDGAAWCYRIIRLDKPTGEQKLIYTDPSFGESWLPSDMISIVCDYGSFLAVGDLSARKRELAGFLANISHETGGGSVDGNVDEILSGLFFNEEVGLINTDKEMYVQKEGTVYLPVPGKSYHGRGPIQLSYNYNYGLCSDVLFADPSILLNDPDLVDRDGVVGFMTGIWFWMTPQPPKPSCHQVINGIWNPAPGTINAEFNGQFGLTIVIINNESGQSENSAGAVARRCRYFRRFCEKMGVDLGSQQVDTMGMQQFR